MNTAFVYFTMIFGLIHQNPLSSSKELTTIACGEKLELLESLNPWAKVKFKAFVGYVRSDFLSSSAPSCFTQNYPEFFNSFNLNLSAMNLWAKLYESYLNDSLSPTKKVSNEAEATLKQEESSQ